VEFEAAWAVMVGEEGRGVPTIIEMVNGTRLDCVIGSAALMRQAVSQAGWHVSHRSAFGSTLVDKPLMKNVVADLEIETEAATTMMMRLAGAFDRAGDDPAETAMKRIALPIAKYWVTKRTSETVREALECLGGNGYVEESIMPRLYRESPLNAIWEGSGNVICLDVLRAASRTPDSLEVFFAELDLASGIDPRLDAAIADAKSAVSGSEDLEFEARRIVERLATTWAGSLLARHGDSAVFEAYAASRLQRDHGALFGTLSRRHARRRPHGACHSRPGLNTRPFVCHLLQSGRPSRYGKREEKQCPLPKSSNSAPARPTASKMRSRKPSPKRARP
jgi:putative acyl-CoA dehydrogenase